MFRFSKISALLVIAIIFGFVSCDKDENEDVDIQIIGDAFVLKRMLDEKIQYGHAYYLYGNYPLSSASVTAPDQETITLVASDQLSLVFSKEPFFDDYSEDLPQNGLFDFNAKYIDEVHNTTDNLDYIDMVLPEFTSTEFLGSTNTLKIEWNTVPEANSYLVRMIDVDGAIFFTGYLLDEEANSYEINSNTGNWKDLPSYNQPLVVEIHASRYEQNSDESEFYHIEEISIGELSILWGVE